MPEQTPTKVKRLRLGDMIFNRQGAFIRRVLHAVVSIAVRLFFRRIETVNAEAVPHRGGLIFVMNHPNGLIDPALLFVALPRKASFLAKSTLFKTPVLSYILRVIEALPVYRRIDSADAAQNAKTFEASHELLRRGGAIALFPEGVSHNSPKLLPIKTGAARIAFGALLKSGTGAEIDLKIVPVGLFYTSKTTFRSEALLHFGEPFPVKPVEPENGDFPREAVKALTDKIENSLREVTLNAETDSAFESADEAAKLFLSVSESFDLKEPVSAKFDLLQKYLAETGEAKGKNAGKLGRRISAYKKKLRLIGLEPEDLMISSHPVRYVFRNFLGRVLLLLLVFPLALAGMILHFPAYRLSELIAARYAGRGLDDIISTVKILSGILLMPLTWAALAGILYFYLGAALPALLSIPAAFLCGYTALRFLEELEDLRGWFRAVALFFRRRDLFMELVRERRALHAQLKDAE